MSNWVIIGQPMCIWCERVRGLLSIKGHSYTYFDTKDHPSLKEFLSASGVTTVPCVYLDGDKIGGYEDVKDYLNHGR